MTGVKKGFMVKPVEQAIDVAILAAGGSSRMGRPKQLLVVEGEALVRRVARRALSSSCRQVLVVLGAGADSVQPVLEDLAVTQIKNPNWAQGLSSSIRAAAKALLGDPSPPDAILFLTVDQPEISTEAIDRFMVRYRESNKTIVAAQYRKTLGVPALFENRFFCRLCELKGEAGVKRVIQANPSQVLAVPLAAAGVDLDTPEDWARFERMHRRRPDRVSQE